MADSHEARQSPDSDLALLVQVKSYLRELATDCDRRPAWQHAWERFYELYGKLLLRMVVHCGPNLPDYEACVQEVWIEIIQRLPDYEYRPQVCRFRTWLYRIVRNKVIDTQRRLRTQLLDERQARYVAAVVSRRLRRLDPLEALDQQEQHELVEELLRELRRAIGATKYRVLCLRGIEGKTTTEVAEELGVSHEEVRWWYHRAKQRLRRLSRGMISKRFPDKTGRME